MQTRHAAHQRGPDAAREALLAGYRQARALLQDLADGFRAQEVLLAETSLAGARSAEAQGAPLSGALQPEPAVVSGRAIRPPLPEGPEGETALLTLLCLGPFRIRIGDVPVDLGPGGKPLAILKFLATRGHRPTPRDVLLEAIWPETAADTAANRLRVAVHERDVSWPWPAPATTSSPTGTGASSWAPAPR